MASQAVIPYEQQLDADADWALREGSMFFENGGAVQKTMRKITRRLDELGIPHVIAGGMALYLHGYRRFTEDVDLLVTREGLKAIHESLEGLGCVHVFKGSKKVRDAETGVAIDFLITGDFPGDGKPKPIAFHDPAVVAVDISGMRVIALEKLLELKLASGISNPQRGKDLTDVQEVIQRFKLPEDYLEKLDASVQEKFRELWKIAQIPSPFEH